MKIAYIILVFFGCSFAAIAQDLMEVRAGSFTMGNTAYTREAPIRTVNLSRFYLSKTPITNAQFATFLNTYGSDTIKEGSYIGKPIFVEDSWGVVKENGAWKSAVGYESYPVVKVTWYGAQAFCSEAGGRLPTEAEWEYAAKGGPVQQAYTFSGSNTATNVAWFYDNSNSLNHPVGLKTANNLGLFDMSGNVYQWCSDWFGRYADFGIGGESNPKGPANGVSKVIRGGYRSLGVNDLHLTQRESLAPDECCNFIGFRLVMDKLPTNLASTPKSALEVYPNPTNDLVYIRSTEEIYSLELLDIQGVTHYKSTEPTNILSLKDHPNGTYFIRIATPSKTLVQKMIVLH